MTLKLVNREGTIINQGSWSFKPCKGSIILIHTQQYRVESVRGEYVYVEKLPKKKTK